MKQNLFFSIGLALVVGVGAAVGARAVIADQKSGTCSYDPVSGNFIENGLEHNFGSWEHARRCARDGRLPEIVLNRLGAFGDTEIRIEAEKLKAENRRVAALRRSQQQKKLIATGTPARLSLISRGDNQAGVLRRHERGFSEPARRMEIPQAIKEKGLATISTDPVATEVLTSKGENDAPETFGLETTTDLDPNRRTAMELGTDDENSTDWIK